jgi:hypothetical protein
MCKVEGRLITHIEERLQQMIEERKKEEAKETMRDNSRKRVEKKSQKKQEDGARRRRSRSGDRDMSSERSSSGSPRRRTAKGERGSEEKDKRPKESEKDKGRGTHSTHSHSVDPADSDDESLYLDIPFEAFLLKKNFDYILVDKEDIVSYTGKSETKINQALKVPYHGSLQLVSHFISQMYKDSRFDMKSEEEAVIINDSIFITKDEDNNYLNFKWVASKKNDIIADCLAYMFSQFPQNKEFDMFQSRQDVNLVDVPSSAKDKDLEVLQKKVIKRISGVFQEATYKLDKHYLTFKDRECEFHINLKKGTVECRDESIKERVFNIVSNLFPSLN